MLRRRHGHPPVRHLLHDLGGMVGQHQRGRGGEREQGGLHSEEVCWFKSIILEILFVAKQALLQALLGGDLHRRPRWHHHLFNKRHQRLQGLRHQHHDVAKEVHKRE